MVMVTDKEYSLDSGIKNVLDMCCDRCTGKRKMDNLWIVDGDEGYGKTTWSIHAAYYVAWKTGRPFSVKNIFFDIDDMIKFAQNNKDQVIVWDEAALAGLASEWQTKVQQKLLKLLMVARKKRHFYFFNIPKFFKLNEYLVVDRSIAMVHVYARNETTLGRFVYYNKKSKERLYYDYKRTRQRNYKKYMSLHGSFPDVVSKLIDEDEYDKMKDEAIMSIGEEKNLTKSQTKLRALQYVVATRLESHIPQKELAKILGFVPTHLSHWKEHYEKYDQVQNYIDSRDEKIKNLKIPK